MQAVTFLQSLYKAFMDHRLLADREFNPFIHDEGRQVFALDAKITLRRPTAFSSSGLKRCAIRQRKIRLRSRRGKYALN